MYAEGNERFYFSALNGQKEASLLSTVTKIKQYAKGLNHSHK